MSEITITIQHNQRITTREVLRLVKEALPTGFVCKFEKSIHGYTTIDVLRDVDLDINTSSGKIFTVKGQDR